MNNKSGFTLVELLVSLVLLGVLMAITIPNIIGIVEQNKNNAYVEDSEKMLSSAKYKMASNDIKKPSVGKCIIMTLGYLDTNDDYKNTPNDGVYDKGKSFVVIKRESSRYDYYVRLEEKSKNNELRGIKLISENNLNSSSEIIGKLNTYNCNFETSSTCSSLRLKDNSANSLICSQANIVAVYNSNS